MRLLPTLFFLAFAVLAPLAGQRGDFDNLLGTDLSQWDAVGDGLWQLTPDGILLGHRPIGEAPTSFDAWKSSPAWLYTKKQYGEYDLHLDYFLGSQGSAGVSIRDSSRANPPAPAAYVIPIVAEASADWPSGSIQGLVRAPATAQKPNAWNSLNIESRQDGLRVLINGVVTAEYTGRPGQSLAGPIGLQLHDRASVVMIRNIWILER